MDLSRFSIDAALSSAADASNAYRSVFYERLLASLFENDENLFVRTDIRKEREQIFVFPALYWLSLANRVAGHAQVLPEDRVGAGGIPFLCLVDVALHNADADPLARMRPLARGHAATPPRRD